MTGLKSIALVACLAALVECGHLGGGGGISSSYGAPLDSYSNQNSYSNSLGGGYGGNGGYGGSGGYGGYSGSGGYGGHGGHGHDQATPYEFGYSVKDAHTGNDFKQQEHSDGNTVKGQYRVLLPDGRTQIVTYTADWKTGFHADVKYEGEAHYPTNYGGSSYGVPGVGANYGGGHGSFAGRSSYSAPSSSYSAPSSSYSAPSSSYSAPSSSYSAPSSYGPPGYTK